MSKARKPVAVGPSSVPSSRLLQVRSESDPGGDDAGLPPVSPLLHGPEHRGVHGEQS